MADEKNFDFLKKNQRESKPRTRGITEIRGPYYAVMGKRYLQDIMETMGEHVDSLKFFRRFLLHHAEAGCRGTD